MKYVVTCAALLLPSVLATPAPLKKRVARDPIITNNIPIGDKVCDGNTYRPSDMRTAVNFASQAKKGEKQYNKFLRLIDLGPCHPHAIFLGVNMAIILVFSLTVSQNGIKRAARHHTRTVTLQTRAKYNGPTSTSPAVLKARIQQKPTSKSFPSSPEAVCGEDAP